jgi:hypothetical protein
MIETYREAKASFRMAREATRPGQSILMRDVHIAQAAKLSKAFAMLAEALANRRDRGRRFVRVEHVHVHAGGQAIVGSVTAPAAAK